MLDIGGINMFSQGLNNEYRILVLENILEKMINTQSVSLTSEDLESFRKLSLTTLQKKYPNAGITWESF